MTMGEPKRLRICRGTVWCGDTTELYLASDIDPILSAHEAFQAERDAISTKLGDCRERQHAMFVAKDQEIAALREEVERVRAEFKALYGKQPIDYWMSREWTHKAGSPCHEVNLATVMGQRDGIADALKDAREKLAKLEGTDDHPEHRCERCGGRNISWHADSPLWNATVRAFGDREPMLCPICFAKLAEQRETVDVRSKSGRLIGYTTWRLAPEDMGDAHQALIAEKNAVEEELERLRTACLEEHGGKHHEPECPICDALAAALDKREGKGEGDV